MYVIDTFTFSLDRDYLYPHPKKSAMMLIFNQVYSCLCFGKISKLIYVKSFKQNPTVVSIQKVSAVVCLVLFLCGNIFINSQIFLSKVGNLWINLLLSTENVSFLWNLPHYQNLLEANKSCNWKNRIQLNSLEDFTISFSPCNA